MKTSIYHAVEDNAFGCHGCFDRIEIPRTVKDQFDFVEMRETLEASHRSRGCFEMMAAMEAGVKPWPTRMMGGAFIPVRP